MQGESDGVSIQVKWLHIVGGKHRRLIPSWI
jgi:hypothetical protein